MCAVILLIVLSPILLIVCVAIKLDSKGPVVFKQLRSGKNNKDFMLYKFRSMSADNDVYDSKSEDRITKVGRILRKTSLDELPQIFNILKGEMSFIGPRPWIPEYSKNFNKFQMRRLEVLPGITGLAQASGRNDLGIIERIELDVNYVDKLTFLMDIKVVLKTIKSVLKHEGFSNTKSAIHDEIKILEMQHEMKVKKENTKPKKTKVQKKSSEKKTGKKSKTKTKEKVLVGSGV